jgi:hypothetical protein
MLVQNILLQIDLIDFNKIINSVVDKYSGIIFFIAEKRTVSLLEYRENIKLKREMEVSIKNI